MRYATIVLALVACAVAACAPAAPPPKTETPAAPVAPAPPVAPKAPGWDLVENSFTAIQFVDGARTITLDCLPGDKTIRLTAKPLPDGITISAATKGKVALGARMFPARFSQSADGGVQASIPANANTITAVMTATNAAITLDAPRVEVTGTPTDTGVFDTIATTCAQELGMRGGR